MTWLVALSETERAIEKSGAQFREMMAEMDHSGVVTLPPGVRLESMPFYPPVRVANWGAEVAANEGRADWTTRIPNAGPIRARRADV